MFLKQAASLKLEFKCPWQAEWYAEVSNYDVTMLINKTGNKIHLSQWDTFEDRWSVRFEDGFITSDFTEAKRKLAWENLNKKHFHETLRCDGVPLELSDETKRLNELDGVPAPELDLYAYAPQYTWTDEGTVQPVLPEFNESKCECGSEAANMGGHSTWCPKFEA